MWKVIYSSQKSQNKTCMTVFLEEKKFVVFRKNAPKYAILSKIVATVCPNGKLKN